MRRVLAGRPGRIAKGIAVALLATLATPAMAINCGGTSVGELPLFDSIHVPREQSTTGAALEIIDTIDFDQSVGVLLWGMSNWARESEVLIPMVETDPVKRSSAVFVNGGIGGGTTEKYSDANDERWSAIADNVAAAGLSANDIQIVIWKPANGFGSGNEQQYMDGLTADIDAARSVLLSKYPNVQLLYFVSRIYGGYASTDLSPEPAARSTGIAIDGAVSGTAPVWQSWGPYLWADGLVARNDGLIWECDDFVGTGRRNGDDGVHPGPLGRQKVADMVYQWLHEDTTAQAWYLVPTNLPPFSDRELWRLWKRLFRR